jgi:hypothetical protein
VKSVEDFVPDGSGIDSFLDDTKDIKVKDTKDAGRGEDDDR